MCICVHGKSREINPTNDRNRIFDCVCAAVQLNGTHSKHDAQRMLVGKR